MRSMRRHQEAHVGTEETNLPKLAAPARRALQGAGYTRLEDLTKVTESEVIKLHGIGANAMQVLLQRPAGARAVLPRWMSRQLAEEARWPDGQPAPPAFRTAHYGGRCRALKQMTDDQHGGGIEAFEERSCEAPWP